MDKGHLCKAKRIDNGKWEEGYLVRTADGSYIVPYRGSIDQVYASTICRCTNKEYMNGVIAYEGDIFESQCSGGLMILRYGFYQAYCPVDEEYMETVGFYAECKGFPDMPIGDLQEYALKRGNIFDNPGLISYCCKQSEISVAASQS